MNADRAARVQAQFAVSGSPRKSGPRATSLSPNASPEDPELEELRSLFVRESSLPAGAVAKLERVQEARELGKKVREEKARLLQERREAEEVRLQKFRDTRVSAAQQTERAAKARQEVQLTNQEQHRVVRALEQAWAEERGEQARQYAQTARERAVGVRAEEERVVASPRRSGRSFGGAGERFQLERQIYSRERLEAQQAARSVREALLDEKVAMANAVGARSPETRRGRSPEMRSRVFEERRQGAEAVRAQSAKAKEVRSQQLRQYVEKAGRNKERALETRRKGRETKEQRQHSLRLQCEGEKALDEAVFEQKARLLARKRAQHAVTLARKYATAAELERWRQAVAAEHSLALAAYAGSPGYGVQPQDFEVDEGTARQLGF